MCLRMVNMRTLGVCLAIILFFLLPGAALAESSRDSQGGEEIEKTPVVNAIPKEVEMTPVADDTPAKPEQPASVGLEQAIRIAKEAFTVPEDFSQFTSGFDQWDEKSFWSLRWYRSGETGGEMSVQVNAETGDIWSMGLYIPPAPGQEYRGLPKYNREQAESTAAALAEKLQPERFKLTRLQPVQNYYQPLTFQRRGQIEHQYEYARIVDGVPYGENGISVSVNGDTGQVTRFNLRWDDTKDFPPAARRINQTKAEEIFRTEAAPELSYFRSRTPGGKEVPLKLVYRLPGPQDRVVIDGLTGQVLSGEDEFYAYNDLAGGRGMEKMADKQAAVPLSPAEEAALEEAKSLLSRERALEMARAAVKVPGEYVLNNSRLEQDYLYRDKKTWYFNWEAGSGAQRKAMDVAVDAATGDLVYFNTDAYRTMVDSLKVPEVKFSQEEALKIAGDYIKKVQPARWGEVVFKSARPEVGPLIDPGVKPQPRSYSFSWVRLAKDVPFPDNGFNLVVNSATGEITSYRMTWWDLEFPDPQGVLGQEAAADKFLKEAPLTVAYMRLWLEEMYSKVSEEGQVRLVYYTDRRDFVMLDAFTGQLLDYDGKAVLPSDPNQKFDDLAGHPAREAVELLAEAGIVAAGGNFRPDDAVTQAELIVMLVKSRGQYAAPEFPAAADGEEPWYRQYYEIAVRLGIIQAGEKPAPDQPVAREALARLAVNTMGFYQVARLSDIYLLDFQDAGDITETLRGHAALAVGLGLLEPVEDKFAPKAVVTRGEAAQTLVQLLKSS